jgi:hypothetical protein
VGQKTVRFSDLSGELITRDGTLARIVIHEHPELGDGPVEIEALADEARTIEKAAVAVAIVELYLPGEEEPRRVAMDVTAFDKLATDRPMSELLLTARPARPARRSRAAAPKTAAAPRVDAGKADGAKADGGKADGARADVPRAQAPKAAAGPGSERIGYDTLEHAGEPHKGRITDTERELVRDHLDMINERLAAQGLRTIDPANPEHAARYGLEELAAAQAAQDG